MTFLPDQEKECYFNLFTQIVIDMWNLARWICLTFTWFKEGEEGLVGGLITLFMLVGK